MAYAKLAKELINNAGSLLGTGLKTVNQFDALVASAARNGDEKIIRAPYVPINRAKVEYDDAVIDSFIEKRRLSTAVYDADSEYQGIRVDPTFEQYISGAIRRTDRPKLSTVDSQTYNQYLRGYHEQHGTLKGHMRVAINDDLGNPIEVSGKHNGRNAAGERQFKQRSSQGIEYQDNRRKHMESTQTIGEDEFNVGHHRVELDLVDRLLEGLRPNQQQALVRYINHEYPNLTTGNKGANIIGPAGELPEWVHKAIHKKLKEAGLDARRMDFRNAPAKVRLQFINEIDLVLKDIDKFIFEKMQKRRNKQAP